MSNSFVPPAVQQILNSRIQNYKATTTYFGYNVSVDPGSELYLRQNTNAIQDAIGNNLVVQTVNSKLIDSAIGNDLDTLANNFGLYRRNAIPSQGAVQLVTTQPQTLIAFTTTLTGPNGTTFVVSSTGVYNNGQFVPIQCQAGGANTNLGVGSIMTWTSPNPGMQQNVLISVACTGGADQENDDTLRARLYLALQVPAGMGNSGQIITTGASVDSIIQQCFTYANYNGVGSQLIVLTGYQTSSYIGRDVPHLTYDGYVSIYGTTIINPSFIIDPITGGPYNEYTNVLPDGYNTFGSSANVGANLSGDSSAIYGQLPATQANPFASAISTVNNLPSDLAAVLTLPYPIGSTPNGFGNGWLNSIPWPAPDGYYVQNYCQVTAITGPTTINGVSGYGITISAPSSGTYNASPYAGAPTYNVHTPTQGQTQIQWVNRSDNQQLGWVIVTATVLAAIDNGNNTWKIVLSIPLVFATGTDDFYGNTGVSAGGGPLLGDFIFPASQNAQNYLNQVMGTYALLGPGEVTNNLGLDAVGASRYPSNNNSFPETIGVQLQKTLEDNNNEVYQATTNPGLGISVAGAVGLVYNCYNTAFSSPPNNSPPNIWIPHNIGFYPIEYYNSYGI